jgi:hypothetical protein
MVMTDVLDFGVMKYCRNARLLAEQEYAHAKFHREAKKVLNKRGVKRFSALYRIFDFLFLRCGETFGAVLCLASETVSTQLFYGIIDQGLIQNPVCPAVLFHFFEEVEHACVTGKQIYI